MRYLFIFDVVVCVVGGGLFVLDSEERRREAVWVVVPGPTRGLCNGYGSGTESNRGWAPSNGQRCGSARALDGTMHVDVRGSVASSHSQLFCVRPQYVLLFLFLVLVWRSCWRRSEFGDPQSRVFVFGVVRRCGSCRRSNLRCGQDRAAIVGCCGYLPLDGV